MFVGKKNDEFSFSAKLVCLELKPKLVYLELMPKLVRLGHVGFIVANVVVLDSVFPSKVQMPRSRTTDLNLIQLPLSLSHVGCANNRVTSTVL